MLLGFNKLISMAKNTPVTMIVNMNLKNSDSDRDEDEGAMDVRKLNNLGTLLHNMLLVCHKAGLKNVFPCLYDA